MSRKISIVLIVAVLLAVLMTMPVGASMSVTSHGMEDHTNEVLHYVSATATPGFDDAMEDFMPSMMTYAILIFTILIPIGAIAVGFNFGMGVLDLIMNTIRGVFRRG